MRREKIKIDAKVLDQLVAGSQSDIRQIINMLSTWNLGAKAMDFDEGKKLFVLPPPCSSSVPDAIRSARMSEKNTIQTPWSLYSKLFGPQSFSSVSGMTLNDKLDLYFNDHQIMPLFVQDNYLKANFSKSNGLTGPDKVLKDLDLAAKAAEAISDGDLVDAMIHGCVVLCWDASWRMQADERVVCSGQQQWSLMPVHGVFSCVRPAYFCHGQGGGQPGFPSCVLPRPLSEPRTNAFVHDQVVRQELDADEASAHARRDSDPYAPARLGRQEGDSPELYPYALPAARPVSAGARCCALIPPPSRV